MVNLEVMSDGVDKKRECEAAGQVGEGPDA